MSTPGPFSIGGFGGTSYLSPFTSRQQGPGTGLGVAGERGRFSPADLDQAKYEAAREQLRHATASLRAAFTGLTRTTQPVFTSSLSLTPATVASVGGSSARLAPVQANVAGLQGTRRIYTHYSTERSSSGALNLDLTSAMSRLLSDVLGLDTTSPTGRSVLSSSAGLGLDLTSPAAASILRSAASLGLDLTSPEAPSVLASALSLGLDITSAERGSRLDSAALGLDLTSPDAPSKLLSAVALGLDVMSAEAASSLASSAALGLDVTSAERASTIQSTDEINRATTSYGSSVLVFSGSGSPSTSVGTLSGVYTGTGAAAAATSLTVKITKGVTLKSLTATNSKFEVRDQTNKLLFSFDGSLKAGDQVYLGDAIGLTVSFSAGTLTNNHTAATTVSHSNTDVDPNAAFNAAPGQRPQFENNAQVTAGSFTVNGTTIAVNANDTINSVLARITASAAGVTGSFANDRVTLTSSSNSEDNIVLANDTSGLLNAVKLSGATTVKGNVRDDRQVLAKTSQFASVTTGAFTVNGVSIQVNRDTDTLESVLARINGAGAGVTAAFDAAQDKVILASVGASEDLITVSGATGFLAAAKLATGNTVRGNIRDDRQVLSKTAQFGGVTSGSFAINGATIAVDRNADTLEAVLARINNSAAGVTASYDVAQDKLILTGKTNSMDLIRVSDDTSGFLTAAGLDTANTIRGHLAEDGVAFHNLARFSAVTGGSFVVDGRTIAVTTADTIQSIVGKINQSGARVTASFDAADNRLTLATTFNTEDAVAIGSDTSGFLAAAGIDAANTVAGNIRDHNQVLAKTAQFGGVSSGSLTINGVSIAIDAATDTFNSVIARINDAGAGVTAAYDSAADRLVLTGTTASQDLIRVGDDTTGFLAAASLATSNTVRGHLPEDGVALANVGSFQAVQDGSFDIDGRTITVNTATDSVRTIIDKINASGARVVASYDAEADRIALQATYDSEDEVAVGNDSSGFLAAAHLSAANTVRGNLRDDLQVLAKTAQFGGVVSGTFEVGGRAISIDVNQDSLQSVIDRINAAGAGVTARLDAAGDRIALETTADSEDAVPVGNDTTGLLAAAFLDPSNTVRGNLRDDEQVLAKTTQFGSVVSGSFQINGRAVTADASRDSLQDVIRRINASGAGVTASFDPSANRIALVADAAGDELIAIAADTTGLLAAAGLDAANTVRGRRRDDQQVLARTSQFAGVTDGTFKVNGATIDVRAGQDTLQSIIGKINGANVGLSARYDTEADALVVQSSGSGIVAIEGDTSGFLAAAHFAEGVSGSRLNPDAAFNGTGANAPLFDPGLSVQAGSFTVNGVTIQVAADDSVSAVLARISASGARVNATFNADSETVSLVSRDPGVTAVVVGDDTSGFLAAVKLDQTARASVETQPVSAFDTTLGRMTEYAGVTAGSVTINGQSIAVDPGLTTIRGLVSALNSVEGVFANLDEFTGRIKVSSRQLGSPITIADTSGLLGTLGIADGTYRDVDRVITTSQTRTGTATVSNAGRVAQRIGNAVRELNTAVATLASRQGGPAMSRDVEEALHQAVASLRRAGVEGLGVESGGGAPRLIVDNDQLARALDRLEAAHDLAPIISAVLETFAQRAATRPADGAAAETTPERRDVTSDMPDLVQQRAAEQTAGVLRAVPPTLSLAPNPSVQRAAAAYGGGRTPGALDYKERIGRDNPLRPQRPDTTINPASKLGALPPPAPEKPTTLATPKQVFASILEERSPLKPEPLPPDYLKERAKSLEFDPLDPKSRDEAERGRSLPRLGA